MTSERAIFREMAAARPADAADHEWRYLRHVAVRVARGEGRASVLAWATKHAAELRAVGSRHHGELAYALELAVARLAEPAALDALVEAYRSASGGLR